MFSIKDRFWFNHHDALNGIWFDLETGRMVENQEQLNDRPCIKIARKNNSHYQSLFTKELLALRERYPTNEQTPHEEYDKITSMCGATLIKGLINTEEEYSEEFCTEIMNNPDYNDFREFVFRCAETLEAFRNTSDEQVEKN